MAKPSAKLNWTTSNAGARVEPPSEFKAAGWQGNQRPPAEYMNWMFHNVSLWVDHLEETVEALQSQVASLQGTVSTLQAQVAANQTAISSEVTAREAADTSIQDAMSESEAAIDARLSALEGVSIPEELQSSIQTLSNSIYSETLRARAAETAVEARVTIIESQIDAGLIAGQVDLSPLEQAIQAETTRAQAAESELQSQLDAEELRAITTEGQLSQAIQDEQERAQSAESSLANSLYGEQLARTSKDVDLESRLVVVESRMDYSA